MTAEVIAPVGNRPLVAVLRFLRRSLGFELTELERLRADVAAYRALVVRVEELEAEQDRLLAERQDLRDALAGARRSCEEEQDAHVVTRLSLPPRPARRGPVDVAAAAHAVADGRAQPRQVTG